MLFIGLDVGTTGTKAIVADRQGNILGKGYHEYELQFPTDGWVEQNAEDWWTATVQAIRQATADLPDRSRIRSIGISTQGASMLAVDGNGRPLTPAITWMDHRACQQASALAQTVGADTIYHKSGWQVDATLDAAKIMWIREHLPQVFSAAGRFVSTLEFINGRLCGRFVIDPTNGAIRQMLDLHTGQWDDDILDVIGITTDRLPVVQPSGSFVGNLTKDAANELGLDPSVQVFNGAHDQYCAAMGAGAVNVGDMLLATGTTWVVLGVTKEPLYTDSHISPGVFPAPGKYGAMASLLSAGSALKWYRNIIGSDFAEMDAKAADRALSAADVLFYPYLSGTGFPKSQANAKGCLLGLDLHHDQYDIARALMEGVAFETAIALEEFSRHGMPVKRLMMTGGAAKSRLWSELVGYITGCEVYRMRESDAACVGAAMMAGVGIGAFSDYEQAAAMMVHPEPLILEDASLFDFYREKRERYLAHASSLLTTK